MIGRQKGEIVQVTDAEHHWYGALLVVDEDKGWGIMGYCVVPSNDDEPNGHAYIRIKNEQITTVGQVVLVAA